MPTPLFSYPISWGANFLALNAQKLGKLLERRSLAASDQCGVDLFTGISTKLGEREAQTYIGWLSRRGIR